MVHARSASSAATARACRAARSCDSSPPRPRAAIAAPRSAPPSALGVALAALNGTGFGFFGFLVAFGVGVVMAEVVTRTSGYYRGRESGLIAAGGACLRLRRRLAGGADPVRAPAPRDRTGSRCSSCSASSRPSSPTGASREGRGSRLRRVRRVVAGGLVGGAVVLDRRRRRREPRRAARAATRSRRSRTRPATARRRRRDARSG